MEDWMIVILIFGGLFVAIMYFAWLLGNILGEYTSFKRIKEFEKEFELAVKHSQPPWEQMKAMASTMGVPQREAQHIYRKAMNRILTGKGQELEEHKSLIQSYIDKYNEDEPFEGIPSEIRIQLERIREKTEDQAGLLDPLTTQIKDLLAINEREKRHQKYYTMGGFFVGLLGFGFALYTYFLNPSDEGEGRSQRTEVEQQQESTANEPVRPTPKSGAADG